MESGQAQDTGHWLCVDAMFVSPPVACQETLVSRDRKSERIPRTPQSFPVVAWLALILSASALLITAALASGTHHQIIWIVSTTLSIGTFLYALHTFHSVRRNNHETEAKLSALAAEIRRAALEKPKGYPIDNWEQDGRGGDRIH
jgi:hypothetical protein